MRISERKWKKIRKKIEKKGIENDPRREQENNGKILKEKRSISWLSKQIGTIE